MMRLEQKCKMCGKTVYAEWPDDAPGEAVDKWLPMLACNPCADATRKRNDTGSEIITQCFTWARSSTKEKDRIRETTKYMLRALTRTYAAATAYLVRAETMWTEDFVTLLMERPIEAPKILRQYRLNLKQQQSQLP